MTALREPAKCSRNKSSERSVNICICGATGSAQKNNKTPQRVSSCGKQIFATSHRADQIANENSHCARERMNNRMSRRTHGGARKCWQNYVIAFIAHSKREWEKVYVFLRIQAIVIFPARQSCVRLHLKKVGALCIVFAGLFTKCQHFKHCVAVGGSAAKDAHVRMQQSEMLSSAEDVVCVCSSSIFSCDVYACVRTPYM
jgi:hypothetical protein